MGRKKLMTALDVEDAFHKRFHLTSDGCWQWTGPVNKTNERGNVPALPIFWDARQGNYYSARRWAYQYWIEPLEKTTRVLSSCDNAMCVNPSHVLISARESRALRSAKGRMAILQFNLRQQGIPGTRSIQEIYQAVDEPRESDDRERNGGKRE